MQPAVAAPTPVAGLRPADLPPVAGAGLRTPPVAETRPVAAEPPPRGSGRASAGALRQPDAVSIPAARRRPHPTPEPVGRQLQSSRRSAAAPPPPVPPPTASAPAQPERTEEPVFETRVELDAGPFTDFAALSAFERALAHLPKVEDVYVRRLADDRALIELTLAEPAPLLETMRETLPYSLDVRSANRTKIVVNVAVQQPAGAR